MTEQKAEQQQQQQQQAARPATNHVVQGDPHAPAFRMSFPCTELAAALAKAQSAIKNPTKDKTAKVKTKTGGEYEYNYADLASVLEAVKQPFADNGLSHISIPYSAGKSLIGVVTIIMHTSGQHIEGRLTMAVADERPQSVGSAITYARRYMLSAMVGIAAENDDDANLAHAHDATTGRRQGNGVAASGLDERQQAVVNSFKDIGVTKDALQNLVGGVPVERFTQREFDKARLVFDDVKQGRLSRDDLAKLCAPPPPRQQQRQDTRSPRDPDTASKLNSAFGVPPSNDAPPPTYYDQSQG